MEGLEGFNEEGQWLEGFLVEEDLSALVESDQCWGAKLATARMDLGCQANGACTLGFLRGKNHFKNKFCDDCRQHGVFVRVDRVRVLADDFEHNSQGAGMWTAMASNPVVGFRVINATHKCKGPRLLVFDCAPPAAVAASLQAPNEAYIISERWLHLRVSNGTLVPSLAKEIGIVPPACWGSHDQGGASEAGEDRGTKRARARGPSASFSVSTASSLPILSNHVADDSSDARATEREPEPTPRPEPTSQLEPAPQPGASAIPVVGDGSVIITKPVAINRTCQACKQSKLKCDIACMGSDARCSRCERLDLQCIRVQRGEHSSGHKRLGAAVGALRRDAPCNSMASSSMAASSVISTSPSTLENDTSPSPSTLEIDMLKHLVLVAQSASTYEHIVVRVLLRWCSQIAWSRDETALMVWVLQRAALCGLPLSDFAPVGKPPKELDPPGSPPPFVHDVLCQRGFGVAFVSLDGGSIRWLVNDEFDQQVCHRRVMHDSHTEPTCKVCAHFSPDDEIMDFETEVIAPLVAALAPAPAASDACDDEDASASLCPSEVASDSGRPSEVASDQSGSASAAPLALNLQSEVVDCSKMWRIYMRAIDSYVCCHVLFRCAVRHDGSTWIAGSYTPRQAPDGSWLTERPPLKPAPKPAPKPALPSRLQQAGPGSRSKAARTARPEGVPPAAVGVASTETAVPIALAGAGTSASANGDGAELLEERLELMSANEVLSLF